MDGRLPLYIVPVGLEYGNFFRFRSTVLVQIGEPINVSAYLREHASLSQPEVMNLMKDDLSERMKEVILYIPDDEHYDATLETCAAVINQQVDTWRKEHPGARRHALTTRFSANKMTLGQIARLRTSEPRQAAELLGRAADIHREREESPGCGPPNRDKPQSCLDAPPTSTASGRSTVFPSAPSSRSTPSGPACSSCWYSLSPFPTPFRQEC